MQAAQDGVVDARLLVVLSLGEAHAVVLRGVAKLVGEDDHEVLAREVLLQLVGQPFQRVLVGDGALTGGDDDEHVVVGDGAGQPWQLVPVGHGREVRPHALVVRLQEAADEVEQVVASVELDEAVELLGHAAEAFQPAVEARLELRP